MKRIVFDLGAVVLRWRPHEVLRRALPHRVAGAADAAHWAAQGFQGYGGDWADYDRGTVAVPELVARIAARTGLAPAEVQAVVDGVPEELRPLPDSVALIEPIMVVGAKTPTPRRIMARKGTYDEKTRLLRLTGEVRIDDGAGNRVATDDTVIDTRTGLAVGRRGIESDGPVGQVSADSYTVKDKGDRIEFQGRVRTRVNPE